MSNTSTYSSWVAMKKRCYYSKTNDYSRYGGAGITVCDNWKASFSAFYADMGSRPSLEHTLDRLNPHGNYEPGNVRWATWKEQCDTRSKFHPSKPKIICTCEHCHTEFSRSEYDINRYGGKYCSNRCSQIVARRTWVINGHQLVKLVCICGNVFYRTPYQMKHTKTQSCSLPCRSLSKKLACPV